MRKELVIVVVVKRWDVGDGGCCEFACTVSDGLFVSLFFDVTAS